MVVEGDVPWHIVDVDCSKNDVCYSRVASQQRESRDIIRSIIGIIGLIVADHSRACEHINRNLRYWGHLAKLSVRNDSTVLRAGW